MASTSRKRARGSSDTAPKPKPKKKIRVRHARPSSAPVEGGNKTPETLAHPISTETSPAVANSDGKQGSVSDNIEDAARPSKKVRVELEDSHDVSPSPMPESHILKLPPEIIGEILILTGSPQHVLAFARTCKHFCYTLIGEGAQYVWRQARRGSQCSFLKFNFVPNVKPGLGVDIISLPDPPKVFFNEPAYAAFLFDPGPCEVGRCVPSFWLAVLTSDQNCGKTSAQYASFALRIRICNNVSSCLPFRICKIK
jgi:hypothetical protein